MYLLYAVVKILRTRFKFFPFSFIVLQPLQYRTNAVFYKSGERSTSSLALFSWNNLAYCRRLSVTNVDHWTLSAFDKQAAGKLQSAINYSLFDIEEVREHSIITHVHTINEIIINITAI